MGAFLYPAMLIGLVGMAIPIVIHLLNRRRRDVVDWGAMQFLELGRRARRHRIELTEALLMAVRMLLLALVAIALARPFLNPPARAVDSDAGAGGGGGSGERRDLVLILDDSASMNRRGDGDMTPRERAVEQASKLLRDLPGGSVIHVLLARDRPRPLLDGPSRDPGQVSAALAASTPGRGSGDLPAALNEAIRLLDAAENPNPARTVLILTDGQRFAWRPGETARWNLLREIWGRSTTRPDLRALIFPSGPVPADSADFRVAALEPTRDRVPPGLAVSARAEIVNDGPGAAARTSEWLLDDRVVATEVIGPLPAGGKAVSRFQRTLAELGSRVLTFRLAPDDADPRPSNDDASRPIEVAAPIRVLLVEGEPGRRPLDGATAFLRAAMAPAEAEAPQAIVTTVRDDDFKPDMLRGPDGPADVLVLADVARIDATTATALGGFAARGGGILFVPGSRCDLQAYDAMADRPGQGWLPARLGSWQGDLRRKRDEARPAPPTFAGGLLAAFAEGDAPPLAGARLFAHLKLEPGPTAAVPARLDSGDPWIVERPHGKGRVAIVAGPLDADGGTLPVNPDFVPLVNELIAHLANDGPRRVVPAGEPVAVALPTVPASDLKELAVIRPDGSRTSAEIVRGDGRAEARFQDAAEPGIYRIEAPSGTIHVAVLADPREDDPSAVEPAETARLADGWPFVIAEESGLDPATLWGRGTGSRREIWRWLVLAALAGLCLEVVLTRRLVRRRGLIAEVVS